METYLLNDLQTENENRTKKKKVNKGLCHGYDEGNSIGKKETRIPEVALRIP